MSRFVLPVMAMCSVLALGSALRADDKANEIVKQGIAARGGAEKLSKIKGYKESSKGTISVNGMDIDFTAETTAAPPTKMKTNLKMEIGGMTHAVEVVFNGDSLKRTIDGMTVPLQEGEKEDGKQRMELAYAMRLTPLLEDKAFQLKSLEDAKVDGKDANVVLVSGKDLKDAKFYFDKGTHLLLKLEYEGLGPSGAKGKQEMALGEYKEFDGIKQPTKLVVSSDGTKFLEQMLTEYKTLEKVDDKDFAD